MPIAPGRGARLTAALSSYMLLKEKDSPVAHLEALEAAIRGACDAAERRHAQQQLAFFKSGLSGEKEAAYHIDFYLKNSPNWMVIHDLRIDLNGRVAQIDHLAINRFMEIYVIESKNLKTKVRYENGGWERWHGQTWEGFPCPVEQNRRHIEVLQELVTTQNLAPARFGLQLLQFKNVVAVNPTCSIMGRFPSDTRVLRMDYLVREFREEVNVLLLVKLVAPETIEELARKLIDFHRPAPIRALSEITGNEPNSELATSIPCAGCGATLTDAEVSYCRMNRARLAGKALCRACQKFAPQRVGQSERDSTCAECGTSVGGDVVAFCRNAAKRFGGKILCRSCQRVAA